MKSTKHKQRDMHRKIENPTGWINIEKFISLLGEHKLTLSLLTLFPTVILSMLLSFCLRFDFKFPENEIVSLSNILIAAVAVKSILLIIFRKQTGTWRYISLYDLSFIFIANALAYIILSILVAVFHATLFFGLARSVLFIDLLICFLLMSGQRILIRIIFESAKKSSSKDKNNSKIMIIGKADNINNLIYSLEQTSQRTKICGVLCDEIDLGHKLRGLKILGKCKSAAKCAKKHSISEILLLPPYSSPAYIKELLNDLKEREAKCTLRMLPDYSDIADGKISVSMIRDVKIDDLLGRTPIKFDRQDVSTFVKGKNVIVTGGGGSIGSELCRQILKYTPSKLVIFELSEYNLYQINRELKQAFEEIEIINFIGDIKSEENVNRALSEHNIDIVYHAAAYKHVPLMEENSTMAFHTNVIGTANLAKQCIKNSIERTVFISTDKAVKPTSVMGATKRIAEKAVLEMERSKTDFIFVRFGNVLGSSGSVIPLFTEQIKKGGPVTVTTKNMIRYFMSIPEAVDLVLQAGAIGHDNEIMVLDMGEQVKIYDLAKKLIELSGLIPEKDIKIEFTGLRPGEKEYEELMTEDEAIHRTPYDRIFVTKNCQNEIAKIDLIKINDCINNNDKKSLLELIIKYIPEHKFNAS